MNKENNKPNVLVTGAGGGIGSEIVRGFARKGYNVIAHCNNNVFDEKTCENTEKWGKIVVKKADFTKPDQIVKLCKESVEELGPMDILVNNAGIGAPGLLSDLSYEDWRKIFQINVDAMFLTVHELSPYMVRQKYGKIVNISSMWGICGASCEVAYSASKAAVIGFTKALAKELGPSGINVNCVAPGLIDTKMNANLSKEDIAELVSDTPVGRIGTPFDVAEAVLYLCSEAAGFVSGEVLNVNGGFVC